MLTCTKYIFSWYCDARQKVLEVGCGAGNTVFPVLAANKDPNLFVYACDFAPNAVDIVRSEAAYDPMRCHAFVCNLAHDSFGYVHSLLHGLGCWCYVELPALVREHTRA